MRLNSLAIRFRRNRAVVADTVEQPQALTLGRRQSMTLESLNRAAQTRSLKAGMRLR